MPRCSSYGVLLKVLTFSYASAYISFKNSKDNLDRKSSLMLLHNIGFWLNVSLFLTTSSVNTVLCLLKMLLVPAKLVAKNLYYVTTFNYSSGQDYPYLFNH